MFGAACLFHSRKSQEYENRFEWNLVESSAMNHRVNIFLMLLMTIIMKSVCMK